jgi:L-amino acid N-acyltransferase YncA
MHIRGAIESDFQSMWSIFQRVVRNEDTYVFAADTTHEDAFAYWFSSGVLSCVAEENGEIIGMYKLIPNQRDLGNHVANASFMVSPEHNGKGIGHKLGLHCLQEAKKAGYAAIQFNFVVSTNVAAVALWKKLGFSIVGTLPQAFRHQKFGHVDAYVMHRFLID